MADWSQLPGLAVALIARRLELIEDFVAFRRTCTSWRAATSLKDFDRSCPRLPLLMLDPPKGFDRKVVDERKFFSLSTRKICKVSLPEARDIKHCLGSKGWIVMVGYEYEMSLLHPITRVQIPLPTHPYYHYPCRTAVLSASPSETSEYVLMIVCKAMRANPEQLCYIAFWKPGDATWTQVELPDSAYWVDHVCYYNGKFYALATPSQVLMYDVLGANPNKATKIINFPWNMSRPNAHLVECAGRLLVIAPSSAGGCGTPRDDLKMVELDVMKGTYKNITSLGNSTVFIGDDEGFSVDATNFPGVIEPNYIYSSRFDGRYYAAKCGRHQTDATVFPRQRNGIQLSDINGSREIFGGVWVNI